MLFVAVATMFLAVCLGVLAVGRYVSDRPTVQLDARFWEIVAPLAPVEDSKPR